MEKTGVFRRDKFEIAVRLFSTMLVRVGVAAENLGVASIEDFGEVSHTACEEYFDTLTEEELTELGLFLGSIGQMDWDVAMLSIARRLLASVKEELTELANDDSRKRKN